jgi:hypothetical protein
MQYPDFFDQIQPITMFDPLSAMLGTFEAGRVEFTYLEIVKAAGHSCPTVAGAYLMTSKALASLYPDSLPERGQIEVEFKEYLEEGVAGVIGNVITHITGATDRSGFKGIKGNFARHGLMHFGSEIRAAARFTRRDNGTSVDLFYHPEKVLPQPRQQSLMQRIVQGEASPDEKREFGGLWQQRVKEILIDNATNDEVIRVVTV